MSLFSYWIYNRRICENEANGLGKMKMKERNYALLYKVAAGNTAKSLLGVPYGLMSAFLLADIIQAAMNTDFEQLLRQSLLLVGIAICYYVIDYMVSVAMQVQTEVGKHQFKATLLSGFLSRSMKSLSSEISKGEVIERLEHDVNEIVKYFTNSLPTWLAALVTAAAYAVYFATVDVWICGLLLLAALLHVIPPVLIKRYMRQNYLDAREIEARLTNHVLAGYRGFKVLQVYGAHAWFLNKLRNIHTEYHRIGKKAERTITVEQGMTASLEHIIKFGTYGLVAILTVKGAGDLKAGLAVLALSTEFYRAAAQIFNYIVERPIYVTARARVEGLMGLELEEPSLCVLPPEVDQPLVFIANLPVGSPGREVIVNLSVKEKSRILLQGPNGSGKSTLLNVLLRRRLYDRGSIMYKGNELSGICEETYLQEISWLPQEDCLLSITPKQLYQMMFQEGTDRWSAMVVWSERFGLNKVLLEQRPIRDLSGGERKKVYLIAALLKPASLILLDEPDNYLDAAARSVLQQWLEKTDQTLLMVSHGEGFIEQATVVVELQQGDINLHRRNGAHA